MHNKRFLRHLLVSLLASLLAVTCSILTPLADIVEYWDGQSTQGDAPGGQTDGSYNLHYDDYTTDCIVGYRFSVYDKDGNKKGDSGDVYRTTMGERFITFLVSANVSTTGYDKLTLFQMAGSDGSGLKDITLSTSLYSLALANGYAYSDSLLSDEEEMQTAPISSLLPANPSGLKEWCTVENAAALAIAVCGTRFEYENTFEDFNDYILIEPLIMACCNGINYVFTVSEWAIYQAASAGGFLYDSVPTYDKAYENTYGNIIGHMSGVIPLHLYGENGFNDIHGVTSAVIKSKSSDSGVTLFFAGPGYDENAKYIRNTAKTLIEYMVGAAVYSAADMGNPTQSGSVMIKIRKNDVDWEYHPVTAVQLTGASGTGVANITNKNGNTFTTTGNVAAGLYGIRVQVNEEWINTGKAIAVNGNATGYVDYYDLTIDIKKDGAAWKDFSDSEKLIVTCSGNTVDCYPEDGVFTMPYLAYSVVSYSVPNYKDADDRTDWEVEIYDETDITEDYYTLTVEKGTGIGSVDGGNVYLKGQTANISAYPATVQLDSATVDIYVGDFRGEVTIIHSGMSPEYTQTATSSHVIFPSVASGYYVVLFDGILSPFSFTAEPVQVYRFDKWEFDSATPESIYDATTTIRINGTTTVTATAVADEPAPVSVPVALHINPVAHSLTGFAYEGNSGGGHEYVFDNTVFSAYTGDTLFFGSDYAATAPNGCYLNGLFRYEGEEHSLGSYMEQADASMSFEYLYAPADYTITYNLNGGTNSPLNPASYNVLYGVTFEAPTREGYTFEGWYIGGERADGINSGATAAFANRSDLFNQLAARTTGSKTVEARWAPILPDNYSVTVTARIDGVNAAPGAGWLKLSVNGSESSYSGQSVALTVARDAVYSLYAKKSDGSFAAIASNVTATADASYTADYYTLTLTAGSGISSVSGAGVFYANEAAPINAAVAAGYTWAGWAGSESIAAQSSTVSMTGAKELTATASVITATLAVNPNGGSYNGSNGITEISGAYGTGTNIAVPVKAGYALQPIDNPEKP